MEATGRAMRWARTDAHPHGDSWGFRTQVLSMGKGEPLTGASGVGPVESEATREAARVDVQQAAGCVVLGTGTGWAWLQIWGPEAADVGA